MKRVVTILFALMTISVFGNNDPTEEAATIVAEGKLLYKSEMASWYGTDLFMEKYKDKENIGGYFSYTENEISKCIFHSRTTNPKVIGTITFDSTYNTKTAKIDLSEREFTTYENELYILKTKALREVYNDTLFKVFKNTNLNLIPLSNDNEKKVYILTGPQKSGVVIFGNDYLLTFDKDYNLINKKQLHKNMIPISFGEKDENGNEIAITVHTHLPETGDFITATDICTLMLYSRFTTWKTHHVISKKYMSMWNCTTNELMVIPMETIEKINEEDEKQD